jgi:CubicO group peptidase (beta-lactamase class C family)
MRLIAATMALALATFGSNSIAAESAAPQLTSADVGAWLDGFVPYAMGTGDIAGGVVAVVKGDEILAMKGYGYADVATKSPSIPSARCSVPAPSRSS